MRPLNLARLDTPLEPLPRASRRLGPEIWVKRDDLTGWALSGNKVRKLDYLLAEAVAQGARAVITTGGAQSNHARATAIAARRLGMHPVLLLRGAPDAPVVGNLLLDALCGAEIHWIPPERWPERDAWMARIARESHPGAYIIPEGGSNATGALGYLRAAREVQAQALAADVEFDTHIVAVGSGGTLAGLVAAGLDSRVLGVAVCDDRATFTAKVLLICEALAERGLGVVDPPGARWDVLEGFVGRGYALSQPAELAELGWLAREEGVVLDPVYTGKAWYALVKTLEHDPLAFGRRVLFWHTGGGFGLFGREAELLDALADKHRPTRSEPCPG